MSATFLVFFSAAAARSRQGICYVLAATLVFNDVTKNLHAQCPAFSSGGGSRLLRVETFEWPVISYKVRLDPIQVSLKTFTTPYDCQSFALCLTPSSPCCFVIFARASSFFNFLNAAAFFGPHWNSTSSLARVPVTLERNKVSLRAIGGSDSLSNLERFVCVCRCLMWWKRLTVCFVIFSAKGVEIINKTVFWLRFCQFV